MDREEKQEVKRLANYKRTSLHRTMNVIGFVGGATLAKIQGKGVWSILVWGLVGSIVMGAGVAPIYDLKEPQLDE